MLRKARRSVGGIVYHCLNRANARAAVFHTPGDYEAFERVMGQARQRIPVRLLAYCLMPNHFHLVLWPRADGDLSAFIGWLTMTHTQRWHAHHRAVGAGHLYQGRFKSFPVQDDSHFLVACRYVERNPLRAGLVARADAWRWSSLWRRTHPAPAVPGQEGDPPLELDDWPIDRPADWLDWVNNPQTPAEEEAIRQSIRRGQPFGTEPWRLATAAQLGLEHTLRPTHRPPRSRDT